MSVKRATKVAIALYVAGFRWLRIPGRRHSAVVWKASSRVLTTARVTLVAKTRCRAPTAKQSCFHDCFKARFRQTVVKTRLFLT